MLSENLLNHKKFMKKQKNMDCFGDISEQIQLLIDQKKLFLSRQDLDEEILARKLLSYKARLH
jgi:hypothetical protein